VFIVIFYRTHNILCGQIAEFFFFCVCVLILAVHFLTVRLEMFKYCFSSCASLLLTDAA